jgi:hypothetical protein
MHSPFFRRRDAHHPLSHFVLMTYNFEPRCHETRNILIFVTYRERLADLYGSSLLPIRSSDARGICNIADAFTMSSGFSIG